ncbi:carbohydrate ABC transporter permease [Paenibacillus eucommiae]|uniref:Multiple sugar transport system permease protein n=1 Tax=Paenibacillus eucommiae TaxID=1355755 RepID=A0ABS4IT67_9BACL|nr:sugar ABC transporter permease [Paenibacillus eucommiae]MBP1990703.1 multiple sugar transport system permease protein [Paenibacillus eucommiae]
MRNTMRSTMRTGTLKKHGWQGILATLWKQRISYLFIAPFMICFTLFIVIPIVVANALAFFSFNAISMPTFIGWDNFLAILTQDRIFLQNAIPNTFKFAIIVGPLGYALSFFLAWLIHQLPKRIRDIFTIAIYTPSLSAGIAMSVVWLVIFNGDRVGYLNNILLSLGIVSEPQLWLQDPQYFMNIMIVVSLWASMGVGFLAMLAGLQTVNSELYEAGSIDGISNRLQEIYYITIPSIKPQMLFGAVMSVVGTLKAGAIGTMLAGSPITPQYSGHLITNHIDDFAFIRYELGYSSALSVVLLLIVYASSKLAFRLFATKGDE